MSRGIRSNIRLDKHCSDIKSGKREEKKKQQQQQQQESGFSDQACSDTISALMQRCPLVAKRRSQRVRMIFEEKVFCFFVFVFYFGGRTFPRHVTDQIPSLDEVRLFALQPDDALIRSLLKLLVFIEALLRLLGVKRFENLH